MPWLLRMSLVVAAIMAVAHLYVGWRFFAIAKNYSSKRLLRWCILLFFGSFYLLPVAGLVHYLVGGQPDLLTYPQPPTYWFWFGLVLAYQLLSGMLILDVGKWSFNIFSSFSRRVIQQYYARAVLLVACVLFVYTGVKMIHDTRNIEIEYITASIAELPEGLDDFRIIHISDLQGDEYTGRAEIARYINKVNALQPDLVVFTGDLISYGTDFIAMATEELAEVKATYGLYGVIGDHDYWAGVENIRAAYKANNIPLLRDENTMITADGDSLLLTGITEVYSRHISPDSLQQLLGRSKGMPLKVIISHQATPKVVKAAEAHGYELLLAGHTHGGQLRVPFLFMHFSAPSFETAYLSGVYHVGELLLNINNGLGFTLAPIRYDAQPNISVIDLSQEE